MADVFSVEEVLQKYCDCVFEVIVNDSSLDALPECCCNFANIYGQSFPTITQEFSPNVYHKVIFYIEDSFNDYINKIIQNADSSVLRFNADNVSDMLCFLKTYCENKCTDAFPEETFEEIGLLISQKFRAFKNAVLFNRNITLKPEDAVIATMHKYQAEIDEKMRKAETTIEKVKVSTMETIAASERKASESSIGILGVFSAIVLVFNAAVSFYASAFSAFSNASIYKILTILITISIVMIGAMMGLFYYLDRVRKSAQPDIDKYCIKTISETDLSDEDGSSFQERRVYILDKTEGGRSILKSLLPFLITLVVLFACLFAVLASWRNGCVERRNKDVDSCLTQTTYTSNSGPEENPNT